MSKRKVWHRVTIEGEGAPTFVYGTDRAAIEYTMNLHQQHGVRTSTYTLSMAEAEKVAMGREVGTYIDLGRWKMHTVSA